jgi:hypothetical protein
VVQIWPGVEALDEQDALGRRAQREVVADDGRRLAAELQRHRAQVLRRRGHHRAAGGARAGEQQVVEGQLRELDADAAGLVEELQLLGREVGRHAIDQQRARWREFSLIFTIARLPAAKT